jgi:predicted RecA/RadA family phage recombinase
MADAVFKHGDPTYQDYVPSSDVAAGQVLVLGNYPVVAHLPITGNTLGAVATAGGYYEMTVDVATPNGTKVYWDDVTKKVTATAGALKPFGWIVTGTSIPNQVTKVYHQPAA